MSVLIIGKHQDFHARCVAWALKKKEIPSQILDLTPLPSSGSFSYQPNHFSTPANPGIFFSTPASSRQALSIDEVKLVWSRRAVVSAKFYDYSTVHPEDEVNVKEEMAGFLPGAYHALEYMLTKNDAVWINSYACLSKAKSKSLQLQKAYAAGFAVPDTLVGNDPQAVREFCIKHGGEIIVKSFFPKEWKTYLVSRILPTTVIRLHQLQNDAAIQLCPAIYQNHIKKQYELRVLVLGDDLIAVKLDSQVHAHSRTDWRMDNDHGLIQMTPYTLSAASTSRIHHFMKLMGLRFGSIDLIVDEHGQEIFLEINEQGQFLFLEAQNPELPILSAVCQFFATAGGYKASGDWPCFKDYIASEDHQILRQELTE
ncbi:hypothetical protein ACO0LF_10650 [Undibacterium sp. Di27W]|uniref:hypothetical protein n=1 Tax=Undibacterium sp. Di27W TaxID=3413036 RepID=UPI003BF1C604